MTPIVLTFAGPIASGKSTLSKNVAQVLGWTYASFGDYVRHIANQTNRGNAREVLQETGASLIRELGWDNFCRSVLDHANWKTGRPLVVDGIRHAEALQALRKISAPSNVLLVFIDLNDSEIKARASGRQAAEDLQQSRIHSTEEQVDTVLPPIADLILDGSLPVQDLVNDVVMWIQEQSL